MINGILRILSETCRRQDWRLAVTNANDNETYLDFIYFTSSGEPFTITVSLADLSEVANELMIEFENFNSDLNVQYFLEGLNTLTPEIYFKTLTEVENIRLRIWILSVEIHYLADRLRPLTEFIRQGMN